MFIDSSTGHVLECKIPYLRLPHVGPVTEDSTWRRHLPACNITTSINLQKDNTQALYQIGRILFIKLHDIVTIDTNSEQISSTPNLNYLLRTFSK
jgi:hypothetical protein